MGETKKNKRNNPEVKSNIDSLLKDWKNILSRDTLAAIVDGINKEQYTMVTIQSTYSTRYFGYVKKIGSEYILVSQDLNIDGFYELARKSISTITL